MSGRGTVNSPIDRTTVVLSIQPIYADRILDGTKLIEFRRKPLPAPVRTVLIWRSGLGGGFAGQFTIPGSTGQVHLPVRRWVQGPDDAPHALPNCGIDAALLIEYAGGLREPVWGIGISDVVRFPRVIPGWELGTPAAPQSWRYAHEHWRKALAAALSPAPVR